MNGLDAEVVLKVKPFRTVKDVKLSVARRFGITVADIESECRKQKFAVPRQIAMALAVKRLRKLGYPTTRIAREFGNRHHTTIIWACRKWGVPADPVVSERAKRGVERRQRAQIREMADAA